LLAEEDAGSVIEMEYLTKPIGAEQLVSRPGKARGFVQTMKNGNQTS